MHLALGAGGGTEKHSESLVALRKLRNSRPVLGDLARLYEVTGSLEDAMRGAYEDANSTAPSAAGGDDGTCSPALAGSAARCARRRPGNFHGAKGHAYYVGAISEAHATFPPDVVQSIVASEWYHPGLTAKAVWCAEGCGGQFPLARRLDANYDAIRREVEAFVRDPEAATEFMSVGSHTTQFDQYIAGNGTWMDARLWRGRAFNRHLCERYFRVVCGIVEASPEVWTNPWSHVLLSILFSDSWVPFHQGHTNGQLTYHLPVVVPDAAGVAELAVVDRGGAMPDDSPRGALLSHPEERVVEWRRGKTLVFDDSFTHAVRVRAAPGRGAAEGPPATPQVSQILDKARVVLLMRGWHPELEPGERDALREFIRRGGEERPEGYDLLPITPAVFGPLP